MFLLRNSAQLGLIRARTEGAKAATGDIIVFLDSHCEATKVMWRFDVLSLSISIQLPLKS